MAQCTAKSKQSGQQCKNGCAPGKTKCRIHGGASPTGIAAGAYKTGRYSKDLPARLAARYEEAQSDPGILDLRQELYLLDARIGQLLSKLGTGEGKEVWDSLLDAYDRLVIAIRAGNRDGVNAEIRIIGDLTRQGKDEYRAWIGIHNAIEQRKRLVESHRKGLVEAHQMITNEQMMLTISSLVDIFKVHVTDGQKRAAMVADIDRLLNVAGTR